MMAVGGKGGARWGTQSGGGQGGERDAVVKYARSAGRLPQTNAIGYQERPDDDDDGANKGKRHRPAQGGRARVLAKSAKRRQGCLALHRDAPFPTWFLILPVRPMCEMCTCNASFLITTFLSAPDSHKADKDSAHRGSAPYHSSAATNVSRLRNCV